MLLLLLVVTTGFSQGINDYQYVLLPNKFGFQKSENQYNISTLAKMMLEKYGFEVYFENSKKPDELTLDHCKAIHANVEKVPGFLSTNVVITLKDCRGNVLFTSQEGKSKEKEYRVAYNEAFREAARSFDGLNYKYNNQKEATAKLTQEVSSPEISVAQSAARTGGTLSAQPIPNGYQLVDNTPKVVLRIYKTSKPDSYTAISDKNNGLVFKKGEEWFFEYYDADKLISEKLDIKF